MRRALSRSRQRIAPARLGVVAIAVAGALAWAGCDTSENADTERGRALFQSNCGTCHTLAQAGTSAVIGPNLDAAFAQARSDGMDNDTIEGVVQTQIESPRYVEKGASNYTRVIMPAEIVEGQDAEDVATYVASVAGVPGAKPPQLAPADLFTQKCGICHALAAAGTRPPSAPTSTGPLRQGRRVHREVDRRPERRDRPGLSAGRDAPGLPDHALAAGPEGPGQLPPRPRGQVRLELRRRLRVRASGAIARGVGGDAGRGIAG